MWPLGLYLLLVAALFVRFVDPSAARVPRPLVATAAELRLVRRHHRLFYAVLLVAPVEWWWRGRAAGWWSVAGAALFGAGLLGYRWAGRALGAQLGPLVAPVEPAVLVGGGPYRRVRHPMYLAELTMAFATPLLLGAPLTLVCSMMFAMVVIYRIHTEERLLRARVPGYVDYMERTHRLVPYVY